MVKRNIQTGLLIGYGILLTVGALLHIFDVPFAVYIFGAGALLAAFLAFVQAQQNRSNDKRLNRLFRIHFLNSLLLLLAAYLMYTNSNSWAVMVLLYALISGFLSVRFK